MQLASSLAGEIENRFGITSKLNKGHDGIYEIMINNNIVYTNENKCSQLPENEEIFQKISKYRQPQ